MKGTIAGAMVPFSVIGSGDAMILGIGSDIINYFDDLVRRFGSSKCGEQCPTQHQPNSAA